MESVSEQNKCRDVSPDAAGADAEACIKATAALRKCIARRPDWYGAYFTDRLDRGLDQDRKSDAGADGGGRTSTPL